MPKAKPRFIPYNIDQNAMVVINYQDQLQPGTFKALSCDTVPHFTTLAKFVSSYAAIARRSISVCRTPLPPTIAKAREDSPQGKEIYSLVRGIAGTEEI